MDENTTSLSLLDGIKSGRDDAWERFVSIYGPVVYTRCRRRGLGEADAAELSQNIFLRIHRSIAQFRRDGEGLRFRFWLNAVIKSAIVDHIRRASRNPGAVGGTDFQGIVSSIHDDVDEASFSESDTDTGLIVRQTLKVIEQDFNPRTWQAFWRTAVEEQSAADVADQLEMQQNAVRQAKHRVMKRLEAELAGMLE